MDDWKLANSLSIQIDDDGAVWHAGRCLDMLALGQGDIVVATDTGGVWSIDSSYNAEPLSDSWEDPDMECLAFGPFGRNHLMAGARGALMETDPRRSDLSQWRSVNLPFPGATVHRIATTTRPARVVIATNGGVWWSLADPDGKYNWSAAQGVPADDFYGLATSSVGVIAGVGFPKLGAEGIFFGDWQTSHGVVRRGSELVMRPAAFHRRTVAPHQPVSIQPDKMWQVSLAVCTAAPDRAFAIAADTNGRILYILSSTNGGASWFLLPTKFDAAFHGTDQFIPFFGDAGAGGWHKTISVHPQDPNVVAFAWLRSCISTNGGQTWTPIGGDWNPADGKWYYAQQPPHLHEDTHAVFFDTTFTRDRIYVLSDGGVAECASWRDALTTFKSAPNRNLANLQFLSTQTQRDFWGTLGVAPSSAILGSRPSGGVVIGGGTQDNGSLWCHVDLASTPTPWYTSQRGDGGWVAFLAPPGATQADPPSSLEQMLARTNDQPDGNPSHHFFWDRMHKKFNDQGKIPLHTRFGNVDLDSIKNAVAEPVPRPRRHRSGQILYAVGVGQVVAAAIMSPVPVDLDGTDIDNHILFGLYGNTVNGYLFWAEIASLPPDIGAITAVGPDTHGDYTFVGTDQGRILSVDSAQRTVMELGVETPQEGRGAIRRIVSAGERGAFATMDTKAGGYVLRLGALEFKILTGQHPLIFSKLPVGPFYGLDISRAATGVTLVAATDNSVWGSSDDGDTWVDITHNLPRQPHCADLRFGRLGDRPVLFLSTYGRSVWVAGLDE